MIRDLAYSAFYAAVGAACLTLSVLDPTASAITAPALGALGVSFAHFIRYFWAC